MCDWGDEVLFPDDVSAESRNSDVVDDDFSGGWGVINL